MPHFDRSGKVFEYHLNKELGITPFKCTVAGCAHAEFSPSARQRHLANKHGIGECILFNNAILFWISLRVCSKMLKLAEVLN